MDDINQSSDATQDTSIPASEPASSEPAQTESTGQEAQATATQDDNVPFHEHPRFKELITQKNEYQQRLSQFESQMQKMQAEYAQQIQQMQAQLKPKQETNPYAPLLERLKGIDPEFGGAQEKLLGEIQRVQQLEQRLAQFESQRSTETAENSLNKLYNDFKVPEDRRDLYRAQIENLAYKNPNMSLKDLDNVFKQVHESQTKFFDGLERKIRGSYVQEKKKDATPASTTGGSTPGQPSKKITMEEAIKIAAQDLRRARQKI